MYFSKIKIIGAIQWRNNRRGAGGGAGGRGRVLPRDGKKIENGSGKRYEFFFFFHFLKPRKFGVYKNGQFLPGKNQEKLDFAPSEKYSSYAPGAISRTTEPNNGLVCTHFNAFFMMNPNEI